MKLPRSTYQAFVDEQDTAATDLWDRAALLEVIETCARLCEYLPIGTGLQGKTFAEAIRGVGLGARLAQGFNEEAFQLSTIP